jgi:pSer/pThr/pTyr-binding forkhead associated (FHA) protein
MAKLYFVKADNSLVELTLKPGDNLIGRDKLSQIRLDSSSVSSQHAVIRLENNHLTLQDLKSTNATRVNGKRIREQELRHGDVITLGTERLVYFSNEKIDTPTMTKKVEESLADDRSKLVDTSSMPGNEPLGEDGKPSVERREVERLELIPGRATAYITLLSGSRSGVRFPIQKDITTLGQAGKQTFQISKQEGRYKIQVGENSNPPYVNGSPIPETGQYLSTGDVLELAGARMQFEQTYA